MSQQDAILNVGASLAGQTQAAFRAVATGFKSIATAMGTTAVEMKKLGQTNAAKEFEKVATAINKSTDQLDSQISKMDKLVVSYDKAAVGAKDFSRVLGMVNENVDSKLTAKAEGNLEILYNKYNKLIDSSTKFGNAARNALIQSAPTAGNYKDYRILSDTLSQLSVNLGKVETKGVAIVKLRDRFNQLATSTGKAGTSARKLFSELESAKEDPGKFAVTVQELTRLNKSFEQAQRNTKKYRDQVSELKKSYPDFTKQISEQVTLGKSYSDITRELKRLVASRKASESQDSKELIAVERKNKAFKDLRFSYRTLLASNDSYAASAQRVIATFVKTGGSVDELKKKLVLLSTIQKKSAAEAQASADTTAKAEASKAKATDKARTSYYKLQLQYHKLLQSGDKYAASAQKVIDNLGRLQVNADKASKALAILTLRQKQNEKSQSTLEKATNRLGLAFKRYASYVIASSVVFATIQQFREATQAVIDYDTSLKDLQAITGATSAQMTDLNEVLKRTASDTKFSAVEAAEAAKILGQAGLSALEIQQALPATTELATGTLSDMATTVDIVSTAMRVFGIDAADTSRITDNFANAVNRSKLTIDKLRTAFNYVGPVAATIGLSLEDTNAALMTMANQGIRASTMGTSFRKILIELANPNKALAAALDNVGMSLDDINVRTLGFNKVMHNLAEVITDETVAAEAFGKRAVAAVLALVNHTDDLDRMRGVVERTGTAADMAAVQLSSLGNKAKNLGDKVKNLYIALGEAGLAGILGDLINIARAVVDVFVALTENTIGKFIIKVGLALAAVTAFSAGLEFLLGTALVKKFFTSMTTGFATLTTATVGATTATNVFSTAWARLQSVISKNAFGIAVLGLGYLVSKMLSYREELNLSIVESKNQVNQIDATISKLDDYSKAISSGDLTNKQFSKTISELTALLPNYEDALSKISQTGENVAEVVGDITEKEKERITVIKKGQLVDEVRRLADLEAQLNNTDKSWLRFTKNTAKSKADRQALVTDIDAAKTSVKNLSKDLGTVDFDELLSGLNTGSFSAFWSGMGSREEVKRAIIDLIKNAVADSKSEVSEESENVGTTVAEGVAAGLTEIDPKQYLAAVKDSLKDTNSEIEKELAQTVYNMDVAEAQGLVSHEDNELKKLDATIMAYDLMVEAAKKAAAEASEVSAEEAAKYSTAINSAIEKANQVRLKKLQSFAKEHKKAQEGITTQTEKRIDEETKYEAKLVEVEKKRADDTIKLTTDTQKKIAEIEKSYQDKRAAADKAYSDKYKALVKSRVDAETSAAQDVKSISDSIQDKIFGIQTKGMSEAGQQAAYLNQANANLTKGTQALETARATGDKAAAERATELIKKSEDYYGQLSDSGSAISGLKKVETALISARKVQSDIELKEIDAKIEKEKAAQTEKIAALNKKELEAIDKVKSAQSDKLKAILNTYDKAMSKEDARHKKEMADIDKEIAKLRVKQQIIRESQSTVIDTPPPTTSAGGTTTGYDDQYSDVSKAVASGVSEGVKKSSSGMSSDLSKSTSDGIVDGVKEVKNYDFGGSSGIKERGKDWGKVYAEGLSEGIKEKSAEPDFWIDEDIDGVPVSVVIKPAPEKETNELVEEIQQKLDDHPGKPQLDLEDAKRQLTEFVKTAKNNLRIEIPVSVAQAKADGGPVYAMANGGRIPGTKSKKDKVPVWSRPGEWYITDEAVTVWNRVAGEGFMSAIHQPFSAAGTALQQMLKGSTKKTSTVPVAASQQSSGASDVLSSLSSFGTLNIQLGGRSATVLASPSDAYMLAEQFKILEDSSS